MFMKMMPESRLFSNDALTITSFVICDVDGFGKGELRTCLQTSIQITGSETDWRTLLLFMNVVRSDGMSQPGGNGQ
jgi:hypothetical protein